MNHRLIVLLASAALAGCAVVYKPDIHQGALLEDKAVEQLRPGLTKRQVAALIGTPPVASPFRQSRWDYMASVSKRRGVPEVKNLVLTFEGDVLAKVEGDYFPEQDEQLARDMRRYGNLPKDKKVNQRRSGG